MIAALTGAGDEAMAAVAAALAAAGLRLAGAVQVNDPPGSGRPRQMALRLLPDGPEVPISQCRGAAAAGCRLDPAGLALAVARVEARLAAGGVDVLVVNKFGRREAEAGGGFRDAVAAALEAGVPVLLGLPEAYARAFAVFAGDLAEHLPPDPAAACAWALAACAPSPARALAAPACPGAASDPGPSGPG